MDPAPRALRRSDPARASSLRASAWRDGDPGGLRLLDALEERGHLPGYHLLPAARAQLLERLSRIPEAADAYRQALALVTNYAERRFLERRLSHIQERAGGGTDPPGGSIG